MVALYLGVRVGTRATHRWQAYLMWRHAQPFHQTDPQFHRDISYFVSVLPVPQGRGRLPQLDRGHLPRRHPGAGYLYGALRIRGRGRKMTPALKAQVSVLLGLYLLLKAASYWLGRYSLTTSNRGPVTGLSYTDPHAVLPGLTILIVVAVLFALLLFANALAAAGCAGSPSRSAAMLVAALAARQPVAVAGLPLPRAAERLDPRPRRRSSATRPPR